MADDTPQGNSEPSRPNVIPAVKVPFYWIVLFGAILFLVLNVSFKPREPALLAPDDIVVYNHTGGVITVSNQHGVNHIIPHNSLGAISHNQHGHDDASKVLLAITAKNGKWSYSIVTPPNQYWIRRTDYPRHKIASKYQPRGALAFGYQIEPDGVMYAIKPEGNVPVETLPPQPPNFPILPAPH